MIVGVVNHLTLDGVMQAPAATAEDTPDGSPMDDGPSPTAISDGAPNVSRIGSLRVPQKRTRPAGAVDTRRAQ